jgi:hypothetical protein
MSAIQQATAVEKTGQWDEDQSLGVFVLPKVVGAPTIYMRILLAFMLARCRRTATFFSKRIDTS